MAEERSLPGWPKKKLVKEVRRHLWHYGIRPSKFTLWHAAWSWAYAIAQLLLARPLADGLRDCDPVPLVAALRNEKQPHFAVAVPGGRHIPAEVAALLPAAQQPGILAIADEAGAKKGRQRRQKKIAAEPDPT